MKFRSDQSSTRLSIDYGKFEISISDYKDQESRQQDKGDIRIYWDGNNDITSMITMQLGNAYGVSKDYIPATGENLERVFRALDRIIWR
jgi:hypothetical protein